jgi:hypothetical protein
LNASFSKLPASLTIGFLLFIALISCNKDPYEIGFDLLPPSDTLNVRTTDTCTVEAFSMIQDSVRSDKVSSLVLGSVLDPVFGKLTVGFYSQVLLSYEEAEFGTNPVLDSLVLVLFYNGHYGDTLTRQNVKVYEVSDNLHYDSLYFTNHKIASYPTALADMDFVPNLHDSVPVYGVKQAPHLRINLSKLSNYFGNKILQAPASALASNLAFIKFVKGLYVTASPVSSNGALLNFNIASGNTKMVVYFHNGNDPANDSLHFDLMLSQASARFIKTDHNGYLDASQDLKRQILNHDSAQGVNKLFLQGMGGVKIKLKFPYMKNFSQGQIIAVNDAILQLNNFETDTTYAPPLSLTMIRQDSAGRVGYIIDDNEGSNYFGGTYDKKSRSYFFRLTQHMQNILQDSYSTHFDTYIMVNTPLTSFVSPNRIMLNGTNVLVPGNEGKRFHLKMTYTILNKQ